jgi:hypothetical protein
VAEVLPWEMVDKSTGPLQTQFGPVFGDEAVQTGHPILEEATIRRLQLAHSSISPRHDIALTSGFGGFQAEAGGKGHESTSRAVHRRFVLPAAIAGVRCR